MQHQLQQQGEEQEEERAESALEVGGSQTSLNQQVDELMAAIPPESKCKS